MFHPVSNYIYIYIYMARTGPDVSKDHVATGAT